MAPGISTRATGAASYVIPKIDVLVSGTFQSSPGSSLQANRAYTNAQIIWGEGVPAGRVLSQTGDERDNQHAGSGRAVR